MIQFGRDLVPVLRDELQQIGGGRRDDHADLHALQKSLGYLDHLRGGIAVTELADEFERVGCRADGCKSRRSRTHHGE